MPRFIAVGEVMLDLSTPALEPGQALHAPVRIRVGGSAVTAARCAAAAGAEAVVIGRVGDDPVGRALRAAVSADGVEARIAVDPELSTGLFLESGSGEKRAVIVDRGANSALAMSDLGSLEADALLVSGFVLFHEDVAAAGEHALEQTTATWRAVDIGSARLMNDNRLPNAANSLFANEEEARALTGLDAERSLSALADRFRLVCIKRAELGALLVVDGNEVRTTGTSIPAPRAGAGDALAGTLLAALVAGAEPDAALDVACRAAVHAAA